MGGTFVLEPGVFIGPPIQQLATLAKTRMIQIKVMVGALVRRCGDSRFVLSPGALAVKRGFTGVFGFETIPDIGCLLVRH